MEIKESKEIRLLRILQKEVNPRSFGFKLHIAINETGELVGANISQGNVDDRNIDI